jgi:hypothetical protein
VSTDSVSFISSAPRGRGSQDLEKLRGPAPSLLRISNPPRVSRSWETARPLSLDGCVLSGQLDNGSRRLNVGRSVAFPNSEDDG